MKQIISLVGDRNVEEGSRKQNLAIEISKALIDNGYRVLTGGVGTFSNAVYKGALKSEQYIEGSVISIVPGFDPTIAYGSSDIQIATGLDEYRNVITANCDAVVAIGGGAGTLSEISFAWSLKRLIICVNVDGGSKELSGRKIDDRIRYPDIMEDQCFPADNATDVIYILSKYISLYNKRHHGIPG